LLIAMSMALIYSLNGYRKLYLGAHVSRTQVYDATRVAIGEAWLQTTTPPHQH
jgi:hypothetical protein